ncbi:putative tRNA-intron lyase [Rosa chinensis]|uniref:tRNA-intron lyase n=1 Tax=Rosa chinensis TaxID=74649 RepID=A0A2P6QHU6_ROSCH|nr:putative tRNA-intron lyase [Rosa chinensis]
MSSIVLQLQSSLVQSDAQGFLCGCNVLLEAGPKQTDLLLRACFGEPIKNVSGEPIINKNNKHWFYFGMEEAFFLRNSLKCLKILDGLDNCPKNDQELFQYMKSKKTAFPDSYKAYSHLRLINWVVMYDSNYCADFVAYRHHPSLVHSEFVVILLSEGDSEANDRLRVWSDVRGTKRMCKVIKKALLVLSVDKNGHDATSPSCLEGYTVTEHTISRWSPEQCHEDHPKDDWEPSSSSVPLMPSGTTLRSKVALAPRQVSLDQIFKALVIFFWTIVVFGFGFALGKLL